MHIYDLNYTLLRSQIQIVAIDSVCICILIYVFIIWFCMNSLQVIFYCLLS